MKRRCKFLDEMPAFNFNFGQGEYKGKDSTTDTSQLGSTLMEAMLSEVNNFCVPRTQNLESYRQPFQVFNIEVCHFLSYP